MSAFETFFESAAENILSILGKSAVFTPSAGDAVTCDVDLREEVVEQPGDFKAQAYQQVTTIQAALSDILKEPDPGETFTVDSTVYTVDSVLDNDGYFVKVAVI